MNRVWCVLVLVAFTAQATAAPRKVLVLPIDGNADAATRTKLTTSVQKLARVIDGQVQPGDTTFAETAAAVGCDPATPECAETVLTTLGVAEVVYGTATVQGAKVTVVVKRKVKDKPPKQQSATFAATTPAQAEPALLPLFTANIDDVQEPPPDPLPNPVPDPKPDPVEKPVPPPVVREPMSTKRALGYAAIAGGGAVLIAGLALWSSTSGMQDDIDRHSVDDLDDIRDLKALEDKAASRALFGNVCVIAALALAGYGGYLLYKDRERRRSVTVTPTPMPGGAGVTLTGAFR